MPLQKPHPQAAAPPGQLPTDGRQLQGRRRSLHTISELCVIDGATPEFSSIMAEKSRIQRNRTHRSVTGRNEQDSSKMRSLPPYYPHPSNFQAPTPVNRQPLDVSTAVHWQPTQVAYDQCGSTQQQGWNARRDIARIQHEEAASRVTYNRHTLSSVPANYSYATIPRKPVQSQSRPDLRTYSSHQQLLSNSRSISGFSQTPVARIPERRASTTVISNEVIDTREFETEAYEKASTDSSSYKSLHDSTVRRSRSASSSNTAYSLPPPLPISSPPPIQRYYSMPARYRGSSLGPGQLNIAPPRPQGHVRAEQGEPRAPNKRHSPSHSPQSLHDRDVERARLESLAALTATATATHQDHRHSSSSSSSSPPPSSSPPRHSDRDTLPSQQLQTQNHHHHYTRPHSISHSHSYSYSHLHPPKYTSLAPSSPPPPPLSHSHSQSHSHAHRTAHAFPLLTQNRSVPRRENLSLWNAERAEAEAEVEAYLQFDAGRRARIRERVRRANEMEEEKEMELVRLGRGFGRGGGVNCGEGDGEGELDGDGGKEERESDKGGSTGGGCLSGFLGVFGLRRKG